ncbi:hypothetical protein G1H11_12685 [Phytoactinopolyspora alkaliphila]|uniref:Uncharacterized protein n=1 Tax=Phytoactinopolyspora alkaliphila TaxID=1783498 RepID=A0A6N9YMA3_9ACTN|nr:hypothetical protein [Phytoactinopolyspora alkaliphila]NED96166.1 hypothetical protein [Phytoactinopolyspora alkaliphila]
MSSRASGGTLAAFLIFAAIIGFAGGAYLGTQSGDAEPNSAPTLSGDADADGDAAADGNTDEPEGDEEEPNEDDEPAGDGSLTFSLSQSSAAAGSRIDYSGRLGSGEEGVTLQIQRSIDGGEWEDFPVSRDTGANGEFSGYLETGRSGSNSFRVVRADDSSVVSEPATVEIQ